MRNVCLGIVVATLIWSGIAPKERLTWFMEVAPALFGLPLALWVDRRHRITTLLFVLLCAHAVILCVGGKYTYAEVPIGLYFGQIFGFARNHYDRLGHLAQGFIPAILFREWLIRTNVVLRRAWLSVIISALCLSFSAIYELIEWWTAAALGQGADAFLGTQGDVWDTQSDMLCALIGSVLAQALLARWHDRELAVGAAGAGSPTRSK